MGVITFITLCGKFPFDEDCDLSPDELEDPDFLFGRDVIWSNVSVNGNNLII